MDKNKIFTVSTAHLDTVWSWTLENTISNYIYKTVVDNVKLFNKYPNYVFSFEGAYRYELVEEYYPRLFEQLKKYVASGRWAVAGSSYENGDVNIPSPESLFRNILYGNEYFKNKFGKTSCDIFLPDCFGFGYALPTIAHHSNLKGFTTQKLTWGCTNGVPFDIGKWYGVDGNYIYASLNPGNYVKSLNKIRNWKFAKNKLSENIDNGLNCTYIFEGVGDRGGAPSEKSVKCLEKEIAENENNDTDVMSVSSDYLFNYIDENFTDEQKQSIPSFNNELLMKKHGTGSYTSRAISKRWNRRCEELADMAEKNSVVACCLGVKNYNKQKLDRAWKRFIAHQFHDDITGTSCQQVYNRSWNDYALSMNDFSCEIESSLASISSIMTTSGCKGIPVMVANTFEFDRKQAVTIKLSNIKTDFVRVYDTNFNEVKSQVNYKKDGVMEVVFIADMHKMSYKIYDVVPSNEPCKIESELSKKGNIIQNQRYSVALNDNGDIVSIIDKSLGDRELLDENIVLGLYKDNGSKIWPAWEIEYKEINKKEDFVPLLNKIEVVENGCARITLKVIQNYNKSTFVTYISLADSSNVVGVYNELEWQELKTLAKQKFSLNVKNEFATFDLGLGTIKRPNMTENLYEVPCQKWVDLTDESCDYGVSIISECKYGFDKFNNNTIRMTVLHTPANDYDKNSKQSMMDLGLNRYSYAIYSHSGEVGVDTQNEARAFVQPMVAIAVDKHIGKLGEEYCFTDTNTNDVIIRAVKRAQTGDFVVVRLNEAMGKQVNDYKLKFGFGVKQAVELYASEEFKNEAKVKNGYLVADFRPFEVKTFALVLKDTNQYINRKSESYPAVIEFDKNIVSSRHYLNNDFEYFIPKDLIPGEINACGTTFKIDKKSNNALVPTGNEIELKHLSNEVKILCTSFNGDKDVTFMVDNEKIIKTINDAFDSYARWDLYDLEQVANIKDGDLGFEFTHCLNQQGQDMIAKSMCFWVVTLETQGASKITLPNDSDIAIIGISEIVNSPKSMLVTELYDNVKNRKYNYNAQ